MKLPVTKTWPLRILVVLSLCSLPGLAWAQSTGESEDSQEESYQDQEEEQQDMESQAEATPQKPIGEPSTKELRAKSKVSIMGHFELFALPVPARYGLDVEFYPTDWISVGLAYSTGNISFKLLDIELGKFEETFLLGQVRWFMGNSFYWITSLGQRKYYLVLGDEFLSDVTGQQAHIDVLEITNVVMELGMGNRWQFKNGFSIGVDWLSLYVPLATTQRDTPFLDEVPDSDEKDDVESLIGFLESIPSLTLLKLQLGYTF